MDATVVTVEEWEIAHSSGSPVGTCQHCGGSMLPEAPISVGGMVWLDARCVACGHETSAPGGRLQRHRSFVPTRPAPSWFRSTHREPDWAERAAGDG